MKCILFNLCPENHRGAHWWLEKGFGLWPGGGVNFMA